MKHASARRSNEVPDYFGNLRLAEERQIKTAAKTKHSFKKSYQEGKMLTAQFVDGINHVQHRLGVYEESDNGQIWYAHDDGFIYRDKKDIRDIVTAINELPDMTEDEYQAKIKELMGD